MRDSAVLLIDSTFSHKSKAHKLKAERFWFFFHFFQAKCAPAVLKIMANCLTLAISYFVLLSHPLFLPCLVEKVYLEGQRLAESVYVQNLWGAQFA